MHFRIDCFKKICIRPGIWGGKPFEQLIGEMCKLCVCIFAFISGYGTYISFKKYERFRERIIYCLKKIFKLVGMYWIALLCFFLPLLALFQKVTFSQVVSNVLLGSNSMMHVAWYVRFYIIALLVLCLYSALENRKSSWIFDVVMCFIVPIALDVLIPGNEISHYYPIFMLGYIFSKYNLYERYESFIKSNIARSAASIVVLLGLLVLRLKIGDMICHVSMITFIGPVFCYVLAFVLKWIAKCRWIEKILLFLAQYSIWYWFLHAIFHEGILPIQKIGYLPHNIFLIVIWVFIILTPVAVLLQYIYKACLKCIEVVFIKNIKINK